MASVIHQRRGKPGRAASSDASPVIPCTAANGLRRLRDHRRLLAVARSLLAAALGWQMAFAASAADSNAAAWLDQAAQYAAQVPKTVIELQQFRRTTTIANETQGQRRVMATLIELNPQINAWFLLTLDGGEGSIRTTYHLENGDPSGQRIRLAEAYGDGIQIFSAAGTRNCKLWSPTSGSVLEQARRSSLPYAPVCEGRLYLRNAVNGNSTNLEKATGFLRDHVWGGEKIIGLVRQQFYRDAFLEKGTSGPGPKLSDKDAAIRNGPIPAAVGRAYADQYVLPEHLGIDLGQSDRGLTPGQWYPAVGLDGVYASLIEPRAIDMEIPASYRSRVKDLGAVEASALAYLVAFDLSEFDLGFALGTDHPRVGWSPRTLDEVRDRNLPGPDGIGTVAPLVINGMVSPLLAGRMVATFTGGFKREHGAFHYGALAHRNHGSHYGFIEQGSLFSKLQPGLATLYVLNDGTVAMKTWNKEDDALLPRIKHARQNGVPLVEPDERTGVPAPGALIAQWGPGNWSGSADENLRTLRAGACLQETRSRRFLVYGFFSSATPSAMARVFQGYGCRYAMHLDMNALEHTYLALYVRDADRLVIEHLVQGMAEVDKKAAGSLIPRFLGLPDDRDFFYLVRRERQQ